MPFIVLLARGVLALVFVVAGLTKLADLSGSQAALRDFGVPATLSRPFGVLLPLAEVVVGVALLPAVSAWWAALGALALLLLFIAGIGYNLARGRTPDCHCFGQLHSAPAGWPTLIRNAVLAAGAGLIVWPGPPAADPNVLGWFSALPLTQRLALLAGVLVGAVLVGEGWVLLQVLNQQGRLLLRIEALEAMLGASGVAPQPGPAAAAAAPAPGLPLGSSAPSFALATLAGESVSLTALRALGKPVLLIFSHPDCGSCNALLPEIGRWQRDYAAKVAVALISRGTVEANRAKVTEHGLTHVLLQREGEVALAYGASRTPCAVLVHRDGTIGSPLAEGADAIRALLTRTLSLPVPGALPAAEAGKSNGHGSRPAVPGVGEPAPGFELPDLTGKLVDLVDFRGKKTLLLFWNPGCGFCQRMLSDLQGWEASPPEGAPELLVVSTGTVEANQAMGLRSPVLLDQEGTKIARTFGANGTPMGVLVDAEGKIASELAVGAPAVLALAGQGQDSTVLA